MKRIISISLSLVVLLAVLSAGSKQVKACDRTDTVLDSIVFTGGLYTIYTTLCIGGGVVGVNKGAGGDTRTFAFGFFTPGGVPINISAFTPATVVGDSTGCTGFGFNLGPQGPPFNSQGTIGYVDLASCPNAYTCITSAPLCGQPHSVCNQHSFTVDVLPDSIRVFGAEAGGNPVAGCYPQPDLLIDFTVLPVVWGDLYGVIKDNQIELDWSTFSEINNDHFDVMRSSNGTDFHTIGRVEAESGGEGLRTYKFLDINPIAGRAHYKIVQVDKDASRTESDVVSLIYSAPEGLSWGEIGPVPANDYINLNFMSDEDQDMALTVYDLKGAEVLSRDIKAGMGSNDLHLNLSSLQAGVYYLRLKGTTGKLDYKLAKL